MSRPQVIVVGGGLAGLSAAIRAPTTAPPVRLLERAPRLGGATWSFIRDGLSYDNGQHVFMRCCTEYRAFLERIGSADKVTMQGRMDVPVQRPGRPRRPPATGRLPAPLHLRPRWPRYRHLGRPTGSVRCAPCSPCGGSTSTIRPLDDRVLSDWLDDHGVSPTAIAALWDLVCQPPSTCPPTRPRCCSPPRCSRPACSTRNDGGDLGWSTVPLQQLHGDAARRGARIARCRGPTGAGVEAVTATTTRLRSSIVDGAAPRAPTPSSSPSRTTRSTLLPPGSFAQQDSVRASAARRSSTSTCSTTGG